MKAGCAMRRFACFRTEGLPVSSRGVEEASRRHPRLPSRDGLQSAGLHVILDIARGRFRAAFQAALRTNRLPGVLLVEDSSQQPPATSVQAFGLHLGATFSPLATHHFPRIHPRHLR